VFAKKFVGGKQLHTLRQLNALLLRHWLVVHRLVNLQLLPSQHMANVISYATLYYTVLFYSSIAVIMLINLLLLHRLQLMLPLISVFS